MHGDWIGRLLKSLMRKEEWGGDLCVCEEKEWSGRGEKGKRSDVLAFW